MAPQSDRMAPQSTHTGPQDGRELTQDGWTATQELQDGGAGRLEGAVDAGSRSLECQGGGGSSRGMGYGAIRGAES